MEADKILINRKIPPWRLRKNRTSILWRERRPDPSTGEKGREEFVSPGQRSSM
jgi:hypothetical protein